MVDFNSWPAHVDLKNSASSNTNYISESNMSKTSNHPKHSSRRSDNADDFPNWNATLMLSPHLTSKHPSEDTSWLFTLCILIILSKKRSALARQCLTPCKLEGSEPWYNNLMGLRGPRWDLTVTSYGNGVVIMQECQYLYS